MAKAVRPPGYPVEFEREVTLDDGRSVSVRPVVPADAQELYRAVREADPETLYLRFLGGRPPSTEEEFAALTALDYDRRFALAAFDPQEGGVAIARYEGRAGSDVAEVAVAVDPRWRHVGLATALVVMLGEAAGARGIRQFAVETFSDNVDVEGILARLRVRVSQRSDSGVLHETIPLEPAAQDELIPPVTPC